MNLILKSGGRPNKDNALPEGTVRVTSVKRFTTLMEENKGNIEEVSIDPTMRGEVNVALFMIGFFALNETELPNLKRVVIQKKGSQKSTDAYNVLSYHLGKEGVKVVYEEDE